MSIDLPKPPRYSGDDPEMQALFTWAEDMTDAVQRMIGDMQSRMVRNDQPVPLPQVTVAQLAAFRFRAGTAARLVYVTDETGGATPAFSDGTDWRRVSDRAAVS